MPNFLYHHRRGIVKRGNTYYNTGTCWAAPVRTSPVSDSASRGKVGGYDTSGIRPRPTLASVRKKQGLDKMRKTIALSIITGALLAALYVCYSSGYDTGMYNLFRSFE